MTTRGPDDGPSRTARERADEIRPRAPSTRLLAYVGILVGCYAAAWTASYLLVNGTDFDSYFDYLELFWTGGGFERPAATGMLSIATAVPLSTAALWFFRRRVRVRSTH